VCLAPPPPPPNRDCRRCLHFFAGLMAGFLPDSLLQMFRELFFRSASWSLARESPLRRSRPSFFLVWSLFSVLGVGPIAVVPCVRWMKSDSFLRCFFLLFRVVTVAPSPEPPLHQLFLFCFTRLGSFSRFDFFRLASHGRLLWFFYSFWSKLRTSDGRFWFSSRITLTSSFLPFAIGF